VIVTGFHASESAGTARAFTADAGTLFDRPSLLASDRLDASSACGSAPRLDGVVTGWRAAIITAAAETTAMAATSAARVRAALHRGADFFGRADCFVRIDFLIRIDDLLEKTGAHSE
jgi:hypothetical protein